MSGLVLLHGFTGSAASWSAVVGHLPAAGSIVVPALVGHSPDTVDLPVSSFVDEVDRLSRTIAAHGRGHHLCGYSLGARLALGLLVRHTELFARATLIGAQPGLESEQERADRVLADERWCRLLEERGTPAFVDEWERLPLFASQSRLPLDVRQAQRAERLGHSPRGLVQSLRTTGLGCMPSYWSALEAIPVPVTLVAGELDTKFVELAERMATRITGSRSTVVAGAGHNVALERPDAIVTELHR